MDKINYILVLWGLFFVFSFCSDFLQKDPLDFLPPESYYDTPEKIEGALTGVYDILGSSPLYRWTKLYQAGLESDEGFFSRATPIDIPAKNAHQSGSTLVYNFWRTLYEGINRANNLLYYLENYEIENLKEEQLTRIKGETLFLRAYYYFLLVRTYGGVPLILEPTRDPESVDIPRSSAKEVYEQILKDMAESEPLVLDIRTWGHGGRINKSAVRGILARVCLHMAGEPIKDTSKFADAKSWTMKIINDSEANHSLNPSYRQIFINYAQDIYDINESIWEVEFWGNQTDAYTEAGSVGYLNGIRSSSTEMEGYGGLRVTDKLFRAYTLGDDRREWNVSCYNINADGSTSWAVSTGVATIYTRFAGKYRREYEIILPRARTYGPMNFPLLRYSDVLLMFAEADNEINGNPTQAAIDAVNEVKLRAVSTGIQSFKIIDGGAGYLTPPTIEVEGGNHDHLNVTAVISEGRITAINFANDRVFRQARGEGFVSPPSVNIMSESGSGAIVEAILFDRENFKLTSKETSTYEDFQQAIQDERLRELCFETHRKHDLIRWGSYVFEMQTIGNHLNRYANAATIALNPGYTNTSEKHLIWPIPSKELTLNRALTQNPNW